MKKLGYLESRFGVLNSSKNERKIPILSIFLFKHKKASARASSDCFFCCSLSPKRILKKIPKKSLKNL